MKRPWWLPEKNETVWDIAHGYRKSAEEFQSLAHRSLEVSTLLVEKTISDSEKYESIIADKQNQIETLKSLRNTDEILIRQLREQLDGKEGTPCPSTSMSK